MDYRQTCNKFGNYLGVKISEIKIAYAKCELAIREDFMNPHGTVHGGVIFTLADIAAGTAASTYGQACTTLDAHIQFLAAAKKSHVLYCEANEIKHGKTISVYETRMTDETGKLISTGTYTFFNLSTPLIN